MLCVFIVLHLVSISHPNLIFTSCQGEGDELWNASFHFSFFVILVCLVILIDACGSCVGDCYSCFVHVKQQLFYNVLSKLTIHFP